MSEDGKKRPPGLDIDGLVDEHEEEVSEGGQVVRRRGIYLLPNLFTTGAMFAGFYAIIAGMQGAFGAASIAILFGMLFDGLDGWVARMTHTASKFGVEYDSLSDMVSFGVAPALVAYSWGLDDAGRHALGKFGWTMAFIYLACAALRLARFNAQADVADKSWFSGLASPPAAAFIAATVWVCHIHGWNGTGANVLVALITGGTGILMIVNLPYYSFKGLDSGGRVPFAKVILIVLTFSFIALDPPHVLLAMSSTYVVSGPVAWAFRQWKARQGEGNFPDHRSS